jgi:hypothetical protein
LRASRWRQARPDAVKTVSNFCAGPKVIKLPDARELRHFIVV